MTPDALPSEPRRRIHWMRWLFVLGVVLTAWGGWRRYDFHRAEEEAKALGWDWQYENPFDTIRADWSAAFRIATWRENTRTLWIPDGDTYLPNHRIVRWLQPKTLYIDSAAALRDLDTIKDLTSLQELHLRGCTGLASLDGLRGHTSLQRLNLRHCTGLTSVDGLRGLTSPQWLDFRGCTGVSGDAAAAVRVTLPGCYISWP